MGCSPDTERLSARIDTCAPMPEARASATCFVAGETAYIAFGRGADNHSRSTILPYDITHDTWGTPIVTPLKARVNACACTLGHDVYIGLGFDGSAYQRADSAYLRDWWRYDSENRTWTALAPYPNHRTDRAVAFATDEAIYVGYGFQTRYTRDMFRYDIAADRWDSVDVHVAEHAYPLRSFGGTGTTVDGHHYYGTGYRTQSLDWWAEFMPEGQWVKRSTVPGGGITLAAAAAVSPYILLIGGQHVGGVGTDGRIESAIRCYNTLTDRWQTIGQLHEGRLNHCAFAYKDTIYVAGGDNESFTPTQALWRITVCSE